MAQGCVYLIFPEMPRITGLARPHLPTAPFLCKVRACTCQCLGTPGLRGRPLCLSTLLLCILHSVIHCEHGPGPKRSVTRCTLSCLKRHPTPSTRKCEPFPGSLRPLCQAFCCLHAQTSWSPPFPVTHPLSKGFLCTCATSFRQSPLLLTNPLPSLPSRPRSPTLALLPFWAILQGV